MSEKYNGRQRSANGPPGPNSGPRVPAERDESHDSQESGPRPDIEQARRDVESGQVNTDLYNNGAALNPLDRQEAQRPDAIAPPLDPAPGKSGNRADKQ